MRKHAKEIANIACWVAYGFFAYILLMAGVEIGRFLYGAADTTPPALAKFINAWLVGLVVISKIKASIMAIWKGCA